VESNSTVKIPAWIILELFWVHLNSEGAACYARQEIPLTSMDENPDDLINRLIESNAPGLPVLHSNPPLIHSTSWRHEPGGRVVLTYLVFAREIYFKLLEPRLLDLRRIPPSRSRSTRQPRPLQIHEEQVVAHGLRHLSYLAKQSPVRRFDAILGRRTRKVLASLEPQLAGKFC
jgi:hypothetical protein